MKDNLDMLVLKFNAQRLDYIANVLGQRPYAEVAPVLQDIAQQVALQQMPMPVTSAETQTGPEGPVNGSAGLPTLPVQ